MRVFAILFLAMAACGAPSKMLPQGPVVHQSALVTEKNNQALVEARAMVMSGNGQMDYVLHLSVDDAAALQDITFAYAFETPMPYIANTSHSGYITMSLGIFRKLSQTGFDVILVGGTAAYTVKVPASAFLEVLNSVDRT